MAVRTLRGSPHFSARWSTASLPAGRLARPTVAVRPRSARITLDTRSQTSPLSHALGPPPSIDCLALGSFSSSSLHTRHVYPPAPRRSQHPPAPPPRALHRAEADPIDPDCESRRDCTVCLSCSRAGLRLTLQHSRVTRTAAANGIRTTTVYTEPDALSEHANASKYAVNLGPANAYLDGEKIIAVAKREGCDAVHPGYGFVSAGETGAVSEG